MASDRNLGKYVSELDDINQGEEWPIIAEFQHSHQADTATDLLKTNGIKALSQTEAPNIVEGASNLLNQRVRVAPDQIRESVELLSDTRFEQYLKNDPFS